MKWLVTLVKTTVLRYRAACDKLAISLRKKYVAISNKYSTPYRGFGLSGGRICYHCFCHDGFFRKGFCRLRVFFSASFGVKGGRQGARSIAAATVGYIELFLLSNKASKQHSLFTLFWPSVSVFVCLSVCLFMYYLLCLQFSNFLLSLPLMSRCSSTTFFFFQR